MEQGAACVFFIADNIPDTMNTPFAAERTGDAASIQIPADNAESIPGNDAIKYFMHNGRCILINLDLVFCDAVSEQEPPVEQFAVFKALPDPPLLVFAR